MQVPSDFKEFLELQALCDAHKKAIIDLSKKLQEKEEQIKSLQAELKVLGDENVKLRSSPDFKLEDLEIITKDGEESAKYICVKELAELKKISATTPLTFEETKKLDLLVKNLKVFRDNDEARKKQYFGTSSEEDLLKMAEEELNVQ